MSYLDLEKIKKELETISKEEVFELEYCKPIPLLKKFQDSNMTFYKITKMKCRTGVSYAELPKLQELKESSADNPKRQYTNNYEYILENKLKYNRKTEKYYLQVVPTNEPDCFNTVYRVFENGGLKYMTKEAFLKEYADFITAKDKKSSDVPVDILTINCDNVFHLNHLNTPLNEQPEFRDIFLYK